MEITRRRLLQGLGAGMVHRLWGETMPEEATARGPDRPNILWILGDDLGTELGCYGDLLVHTPNIDRLAREGARYTQAFTTAPVCSPSRSAMITGRCQTSIGAHHHRSNREAPLPEGVRLITDCFREAGCFTCNGQGTPDSRPGKTDFNFRVEQPFDGTDWSQRAPGQPFYAQVNFFEPHRDFRRDPERPIDPDAVRLPPCYPDHPVARRDWALYLESIQILDRKVGAVLRRLKDEGLADNTLILFFGDNGRCHVRDKQFLYDGGIHVPLIVRWPGRVEPGTVSDDLVSAVDFGPTCLRLAGIEPPGRMEGIVFLGPQAGKRSFIVAARDRCDETDDRIRCVRTHRHKYIRNFHPERPWNQFNAYKKLQYPVLTLMEELHAAGRLTPEQARFFSPSRPPEELYDLARDPHELHNLAGDPQHRSVLEELRATLDRWIKDSGDQGETPEDPQVAAYWDERMREWYEEEMRKRQQP